MTDTQAGTNSKSIPTGAKPSAFSRANFPDRLCFLVKIDNPKEFTFLQFMHSVSADKRQLSPALFKTALSPLEADFLIFYGWFWPIYSN